MKLLYKEKLLDGRRIIYFCGIKVLSYKTKNKISSNYLEYYRSLGVKIGEGTQFVIYPRLDDHPNFGSEPFLIEIGNDCLISFGVTFLTHDGSRRICLKYIGKSLNNEVITWKKIKIGNNVFIGCHSIIMPGVNIGNDVVIGAGSVVTKNIPDGEVWAGNPAKFIRKTKDLACKFLEYNKSDVAKQIKLDYAEQLSILQRQTAGTQSLQRERERVISLNNRNSLKKAA